MEGGGGGVGSPERKPQWIPLPDHPILAGLRRDPPPPPHANSNLASWDPSSSRLYLWDAAAACVHRFSLRFGDPDDRGFPSVDAASPSEVLLMDIHIDMVVHQMSLNGEGSALLLSGSSGSFVMYIFDRVSSCDDSIICRTISVGSEMFFEQNNGLQIIQVSWHPFSRTHVGILSSDCVFRLYNLASDLKRPEQEYFLQPVEPDKHGNMVSNCPVAFSFGGEQLWDRFSVFILFSDGFVYVICPVVPFTSIFTIDCLEEIHEDACTNGLKSTNAKAVNNSWFAITWLEATFPELTSKSAANDNLPGLRAHPYASMDTSLALQGPLCKISNGTTKVTSVDPDCNGKPAGFLCNSIEKHSILLTAWNNGQLHVDILIDEVKPIWNTGASPRLRVDTHGRITGVAMICEPISSDKPTKELSLPLTEETNWVGNPPHLLGMAIIDLALPSSTSNSISISLYPDPILPEKIYCQHNEGIDLIILHSLPFSNANSVADQNAKAPSVYPIVTGCNESSSQPLLNGFVALADPFGNSRVIAITSSYECIMLETKTWKELPLLPTDLNTNLDLPSISDAPVSEIINKELLSGPKHVLVPESLALRSLSAESIEGRSALHHYIKLFHEHYVKYAYKVYFELKQHGDHLKAILDAQYTRLHEANRMLSNVKANQTDLRDRVDRAIQGHMLLDQRLLRFKTLPGTKKKPLSKAEREFKAQLENFVGLELDALHSSIETMNARMRRYTQSPPGKSLSRQMQGRRNHVPDAHMLQLKSSMEKLTLVNSENTKKVKTIEHALKSQEDDE